MWLGFVVCLQVFNLCNMGAQGCALLQSILETHRPTNDIFASLVNFKASANPL